MEPPRPAEAQTVLTLAFEERAFEGFRARGVPSPAVIHAVIRAVIHAVIRVVIRATDRARASRSLTKFTEAASASRELDKGASSRSAVF